ncbi:DUF3562 domain-containing protein [Paraherbaspirillum soli]|uniref:DUF3562 domain-containing protein n=1 Tax=Paraherbaspirillum soli TaxID=631222 RepID=A0ABW0MDA0_9BURK
MLNKALYTDSQDHLRHLHYIKLLAEELKRPVQEITPVYEEILMLLKEQAQIHDYLAIFVSRRVRLTFHKISQARSAGQDWRQLI